MRVGQSTLVMKPVKCSLRNVSQALVAQDLDESYAGWEGGVTSASGKEGCRFPSRCAINYEGNGGVTFEEMGISANNNGLSMKFKPHLSRHRKP